MESGKPEPGLRLPRRVHRTKLNAMARAAEVPGRPGQRWAHFRHGADIGVRGLGPDRAAAFEAAAYAMMAATADPQKVKPAEAVAIACAAPDDELLLADWLNALIYEMAAREMLFSRFEVQLDGSALVGRAWGEAADARRHAVGAELKGATYTELKVARSGDGWLAQCVVDV